MKKSFLTAGIFFSIDSGMNRSRESFSCDETSWHTGKFFAFIGEFKMRFLKQ